MTTQSATGAGETDDRLNIIFNAVPVAMGITTLADGRVIEVSTAFLEMFGYRRDEVIGRRTSELNIWANLGERQVIVQQLVAVGTARNLELSFRSRAGEIRQALVSLQLITWNGERCMLSVALDTTEQKRAEAEQRLLQTITLDIAQAVDLESALSLVLQRICAVGDWRLGEAWLFDQERTVLVRGPVWHADDDALAAFVTASADVAFTRGAGLPGAAWQRAAPVWKHDVTQDDNFWRRTLAEQAGLKTALAMPVLTDDQVSMVFVFIGGEARPANAHQIELVAGVAAQLGEVLRRKQAEAAQARRLREVSALVDLSATLQLELSTDEMVATLARHAETALGADSVVIMVRDVTDDLVVQQGRGQAESLAGRRFALDEMPALCSLRVGGICRGQPGCPLLASLDPQVQMACIPMTDGARIIGTLQVGVRRPAKLNGDDLRLLGGIANLAGNALRRISLFQQVRLYRDMFASASDAMVITDMRTIILDVNPAFETLTGYARAEAIGQKPSLLRSPHSSQAFYETMWRDIQAQGSWTGEIVNRRKNGELWYSYQSISTVRDEHNRPIAYISIGRDVTQAKQREQELAAITSMSAALRSARTRREMIEIVVGEALALFQARGASLSTYDPATKGLTVELAAGTWAAVTGMQLAPGAGISGQVLASGQPYVSPDVRTDGRLARPDLVKGPEWAAVVPLIADETPVGVLSIGRPIPIGPVDLRALVAIADMVARALQRVTLNEQLAAYAARVQAIMNTVPDGILLLGADLRVVLSNPGAGQALALLASWLPEQHLLALAGQPIEVLLQTPASGLAHELTSADHIFEVMARPLHSASGEATAGAAVSAPAPGADGWVLILRDVTQERAFLGRVQQQEHLAAIGQLAAGIAHDFKNIISVITLYSQMLMRAPLPERDRQRLVTMSQQATHASRLIQQILDFSRRSAMERSAVDLLPFTKELVHLWERTLPENIQIRLSYDSPEYIVDGDPTRLQQALMNLAINARDVMPQGGVLRLSLARVNVSAGAPPPLPELTPGAWLRLTVSDTGPGIPAAVLPHIFEPFFTTKEHSKGTGLGLAQAYGIVAQHDGCITVESRPGQGAAFIIYLPLVVTLAAPAADSAAQEPLIGGHETILLVEDEATAREVMSDTLEALGYNVLEAANGQDALEIFTRDPTQIALVLTDLVMPRMGGVELLQAVRAVRPGIKVIAMTGYPVEGEGQSLLALGMVAWLQKPFDYEALAATLHRALTGTDQATC